MTEFIFDILASSFMAIACSVTGMFIVMAVYFMIDKIRPLNEDNKYNNNIFLAVFICLFILVFGYEYIISDSKEKQTTSNVTINETKTDYNNLQNKYEELRNEKGELERQYEELKNDYEYDEDLINILKEQLESYGIEPYEY